MRKIAQAVLFCLLVHISAGVAFSKAKTGKSRLKPSAPAAAAPTLDDVLAVHAVTVAHYYRAQATSTNGTVAYPSPYGGIAYYENRSASDLACTRLSSTSFRCSYTLNKSFQPASDSLYGKLQTAFFRPTSYRATYTFSRQNGGWISKDLQDQTYANATAQAQQSRDAAAGAADSKRKYEQEERDRRYNDCKYVQRNAMCVY
jgi:hypothetical protein